MNISTSEKSLMIITSSIVLLCIAVVYIKHHFLEQRYENCRYFARGVTDTLTVCRKAACSPADAGTESAEKLEIPVEFAQNYLDAYRQAPAKAQRYYAAYLLCLERTEKESP